MRQHRRTSCQTVRKGGRVGFKAKGHKQKKTAQKAKFEPPKRSMIFFVFGNVRRGKSSLFFDSNTRIYYVTVMLVLVLVLVLVFTLDFPQTFRRTVRDLSP